MTTMYPPYVVHASLRDLNGNPIRAGQVVPILRRTGSGRLFQPTGQVVKGSEVVRRVSVANKEGDRFYRLTGQGGDRGGVAGRVSCAEKEGDRYFVLAATQRTDGRYVLHENDGGVRREEGGRTSDREVGGVRVRVRSIVAWCIILLTGREGMGQAWRRKYGGRGGCDCLRMRLGMCGFRLRRRRSLGKRGW
ncbi:hypothetical protein GQ44DRAFT_442211 [Phaeosphaeriaceae sp. PMI808]|nr:hypothetical protein GQ44DRAFT_442211 [Phaeosphaeriaceae sp. PMI808]